MPELERLGPFVIRRVVGRGGMGAVYEAVHEESQTTVAVKVLLDPVEGDSELRNRFEAEIDTLKRLRHPNIVRLFGFGQEDGLLYYAMEYVEGPSLQDLLKKKRLFTWEEVVHIGGCVARALRHAHDRGIIHRDIKPANILLLDDGQVKVSDYGIAHFFGGSRLTDANMVIGTIEYMAPEQAASGPLTPKSDIYSLGALMYALLAGRPPYIARSLPEIMQKYQSGPPESVRYKRPEVPPVLDLFLMELLRPEPDKRPANADLVQRRLDAIRMAFSKNKEESNPFLAHKTSDPKAASVSDSAPLSKALHEAATAPDDLPPAAVSSAESRVDLERPSDIFSQNWNETFRREKEEKTFHLAAVRATVGGDAPNDTFLADAHSTATSRDVSLSSKDFVLAVPTTERSAVNSGAKTAPNPPIAAVSEEKNAESDFDLNSAAGVVLHSDRPGPEAETRVTDALAGLKPSTNTPKKNPPTAPNGPEGDLTRTIIVGESRTEQTGSANFDFNLHPSVESTFIGPNSVSSNSLSKEKKAAGGQNSMTAGVTSDPAITARPIFLETDSRRSGGSPFLDGGTFVFGATSPSVDISAPPSDLIGQTHHTPGTASTSSTKTSHFTMVPEEELDRFQPEESPSPYVSVKVAVLSATLLMVGFFFWYSLRSPSADHLYNKIQEKIENVSDESDYLLALQSSKKELGEFMSLYPNDFRAEKVRQYTGDLELGMLERRLERQLDRKNHDSTLSAIEYAYVEAIQTVKSDPERGIEKLRAFVDMFSFEKGPDENNNESAPAAESDEPPSNTLDLRAGENDAAAENNTGGFNKTLPGQCVVLAKRRLEKVREESLLREKQQIELLEGRLELAETISSTDPERAAAIRRAVITFCAEKEWAKPTVEKARQALGE